MNPQDIAAELRTFAFFSAFPDTSLLAFARLARPVEFPEGTLILEQGRPNESLFFLRAGHVTVEVDGERVSELTSPGEIMGEMSVISRKPAVATIRARSLVSAYEVSERFLPATSVPAPAPAALTSPGIDERAQLESLLNKVYATVLTERLSRTNMKARNFEIANRELEAAHAKLTRINQNLEDEIARRSGELVAKIRGLLGSHLQPVRETLSTWTQEGARPPTPRDALPMVELVSEAIDLLKPVAELGFRPKSSSPARVLLCDANRKQQAVARLALGGTGVNLEVVSSTEELDRILRAQNFDLVMCDSGIEEAVEHAARLTSKVPLVLLVGLDMRHYLENLQRHSQERFFVSRDVENRAFTIKNISTTVTKILNQDLFGMDKYLSWGAHVIETAVTASNARGAAIDGMKMHFESLGVRSTFLDRVHIVAEELLMNALYDAPTDTDGRALFNHLTRTQGVELPAGREAKLAFGTDGMLLAVSVSDPFGSLTKEVILRYLNSNYAGESVKSADKGGAGRGLHMIIETADLTIFNVRAGQKTEVISLINLERAKDIEPHPTFHLFFA